MSINLIQFQQGLSMMEFMQQYGTEAKAYRAPCRARWLQGFRCDDSRRSRFRRGRQVYYQYRSCRHQTTLLRCTILEVTKPVRGFDDASIKAWQACHLAPGGTEACTDGLFCFRRLAEANHAHTTNGSSQGIVLVTDGGRAGCEVQGARSRWVNVLLGNVKRANSRSYRAIRQGKYARLCLTEATYRFNRRFRLRELRRRLARTMMLCKPHPDPTLRMASNFHG